MIYISDFNITHDVSQITISHLDVSTLYNITWCFILQYHLRYQNFTIPLDVSYYIITISLEVSNIWNITVHVSHLHSYFMITYLQSLHVSPITISCDVANYGNLGTSVTRNCTIKSAIKYEYSIFYQPINK